MTRPRLEMLPKPYGVRSVSPWTTSTAAGSTPSSAATSCAIAVSLPPPGEVTPVSTLTRPLGSTRTVLVSNPETSAPGMSAPSGVSSKPMPIPTSSPRSRAARCATRAAP